MAWGDSWDKLLIARTWVQICKTYSKPDVEVYVLQYQQAYGESGERQKWIWKPAGQIA